MQTLMIVQVGDYAEAWRRLRGGGEPTFRDQRANVEFVESLAGQFSVVILSRCERTHDESLLPGLRSVGVTSAIFYNAHAICSVLDRVAPELLVLQVVSTHVVNWAARCQISILPMFADLFEPKGLRLHYRAWRLRRALRGVSYPCVANHSLVASQSLSVLGVPDNKIVPWEHSVMRAMKEPKSAPVGREFRLIYVGSLIVQKGVGDVVDAVANLHSGGVRVRLTVVGKGQRAFFEQQVARLGLDDRVDFRGQVSSHSVLELMRSHDAVVVPSRHDYPEGCPNTIFEAWAARTPLIASDHPAFAPRLTPDSDSLLFSAGDARDLAVQIKRLSEDPVLYRRLSARSEAALASLYVGVLFTDLIRAYVQDPRDATGWVERWSLARILGA